MNQMMFNSHETHTGDGRRVAVWTLSSDQHNKHSLPIVIGSGFARRMHHFTSLATYGVHNGFFVSRYDPVNHVGLSDGDIWDFTLSDSLESLRAAVDWTCRYTGSDKVIVVATSLTARVAYELAAQSPRIEAVITAVGVTNIRDTFSKVFKEDYSSFAELPDHLEFEGRKIGPGVIQDAQEHEWWSLERCIDTLKQVRQPLINFIGSDDPWVNSDDIHKAFSAGDGGPRKLLTLERAPHDLGRNAAVAQTFLTYLMEELFALNQIEGKPTVPPFEVITQQALLERRIQRKTTRETESSAA